MKKSTPYNLLPLKPGFIAQLVAQEPYTQQEVSLSMRNSEMAFKIEQLRQKMSENDIISFAKKVNKICNLAYKAKAKWFLDCLNRKDGREQMYMWVRHWLASYLHDPKTLNKLMGKTS